MRFQEASAFDKIYVLITNEPTGCWSYVGCLKGVQTLNLQSNGCMYHGTIVHEFLHALGFFHQQSSSDRDDYINVHLENATPGTQHNFRKYGPNVITNFGVEYDYSSIMHYGRFYFSKNGLPTITSKTSYGSDMGQRLRLTEPDIKKINKMYNCY